MRSSDFRPGPCFEVNRHPLALHCSNNSGARFFFFGPGPNTPTFPTRSTASDHFSPEMDPPLGSFLISHDLAPERLFVLVPLRVSFQTGRWRFRDSFFPVLRPRPNDLSGMVLLLKSWVDCSAFVLGRLCLSWAVGIPLRLTSSLLPLFHLFFFTLIKQLFVLVFFLLFCFWIWESPPRHSLNRCYGIFSNPHADRRPPFPLTRFELLLRPPPTLTRSCVRPLQIFSPMSFRRGCLPFFLMKLPRSLAVVPLVSKSFWFRVR